jgi:hypothetical protein
VRLGGSVRAWMAKIRAEQDSVRDRAVAEAEAERRASLDALMRTEEPRNIWNRLENELRSLARLEVTKFGVSVSVADISSPTESALRVTATLPGVPRPGELWSLYCDVAYAPGERGIRYSGQFDDRRYFFDFCTFNKSLSLCSDGPITPEEAASELLDYLVSDLHARRLG